jgi:predicted RNase H-like HicB family nuclease
VGNQGFPVELEREDDGRWIAEVPSLPGVMVYAPTREEAMARVEALALRLLADRLERGEAVPDEPDHWNDYVRRRLPVDSAGRGLILLTTGPSSKHPEANYRLEIVDVSQKASALTCAAAVMPTRTKAREQL